jgi:alpha-L-fucosidase
MNGDAIYGTKPWTVTRQWSAGEVPKTDYNQEYMTVYDVTKLVEKPAEGKAAIEAFFTSKGEDLYVILPRWPGRSFTVKDLDAARVKSVKLLGSAEPLRFAAQAGSLSIELPDLPEPLLDQPAWVLKLSQ